MTLWHTGVMRLLRESGLFINVQLSGGKVRALLSETLFLDIYIDQTSGSYSYALIDLTLPYHGDRRIFGWDDYPHPGEPTLTSLASYPHHFQIHHADGRWQFVESDFRGDIQQEILVVLASLRDHVKK